MSERGVFAVDRGIWDHPVFADEPMTEREAWSWLISEASFKARTRNVGGKVIKLDRGQLAASVRFMAERWKWSKSRVDRFLKRLKTETMIGTESGTGLLVITICNYSKYQRVSLPDGTPRGTEDGTPAGHSRDKREDTEDIETDSGAKAPAAVASPTPAPVYTDSRHELWGEGVAILTSLGVADKAARSNIGRWLKDQRDDVATVLGAIQRARDLRIIDPIPWITRALRSPINLGNPNERSRQTGTYSTSVGTSASVDPQIASMGRVLDRRRAERAAARGGEGRPGDFSGRDGPASGDDADRGPASGDREPHRQLALLPVSNAGK